MGSVETWRLVTSAESRRHRQFGGDIANAATSRMRQRDRREIAKFMREIAKVCERDQEDPEIVKINACDSAFGHIGPHARRRQMA